MAAEALAEQELAAQLEAEAAALRDHEDRAEQVLELNSRVRGGRSQTHPFVQRIARS